MPVLGVDWLLTPLVLPLISIVAFLSALHYWQQRSRFVQMGNKLPGPPPLPLIGNSHLILGKSNHEIMNLALELSNKYGDVGRGWLGNNLLVALTHPNDIEKILNSNVHIQKSDEYRFFKPWLGNGLLISSGDKWRNDRKLIAPAFHMNVLRSFVQIFNTNSLAVVERMRKEVGNVFDVHDYMSEVTVDILLETAMGTSKTAQNKDGFEYAMAVMKMCDIIHQRHYKLYYRPDFLFNMTGLKQQQEKLLNVIHGLTKKVLSIKKTQFEKNAKEGKFPSPSLNEIINETKEGSPKKSSSVKSKKTGLRDDLDDQDEDDVGEKRRLAFLDLMIETAHSGANLTETDIKEQVDTIMFEGHDTTAAGSSFVLCLLAIHQDIQQRVMEEQFRIFGDSKRQATFNDTLEMKYLERVIFETLRMYPPVPIIARKVNEDIQLDTKNHVIPAGCTVVIGTFVVHRRADFYPNPDQFNPDNFLPERMASRHYYSFIPFSAGPRSCVGRKYAVLKLKILISTILRNYHVKSDLTEADFKLQGDIILKRADGFRLELAERIVH